MHWICKIYGWVGTNGPPCTPTIVEKSAQTTVENVFNLHFGKSNSRVFSDNEQNIISKFRKTDTLVKII